MGIIEFLNDPFIKGGLCFALGALFTKGLDIIVSKDRDRENRRIIAFEEAARKFISVIAREIAEMGIDPDTSRLPNIKVAIIEFKPHLSDEKKKQIEETWEKYKTLENNRAAQAQVWGHAMGASVSRQLLEDLLKFTENHGKNS